MKKKEIKDVAQINLTVRTFSDGKEEYETAVFLNGVPIDATDPDYAIPLGAILFKASLKIAKKSNILKFKNNESKIGS